jgi:phage terminase large subunit
MTIPLAPVRSRPNEAPKPMSAIHYDSQAASFIETSRSKALADVAALQRGEARLDDNLDVIYERRLAEDREAYAEVALYQLNPSLRGFWEQRARYKVLYGGRGSSKSHDAAGHAVFLAANYTVKILCARQFQNRISESVYTLIKDKINSSPYKNEFEILKTSIRHKITGSEFLFYGIARNLEEIKSTEGVDILWLEEAHYLNEEQWNVIEPTIRKDGSQVWLIFNPDEYTDFVYQKFVVDPPADAVVREINWQDNPYLSRVMLEVIYDFYKREPESAPHVYGGQPKMGADKSIIPLKYIIAAVDAHKGKYKWEIPDLVKSQGFAAAGRWMAANPEARKCVRKGWAPGGTKATGFDVADDGQDKNALVTTHGNIVMLAEEWQGLEDELLKSCTKVWNHARDNNSQIVWDSIGVGAFAGSKFKDLNDQNRRVIRYEPFNAGGAVEEPKGVYMRFPHVDILNGEHFSNIKAQKWDEVAQRFRKTYEYVELGVSHPFDELISLNSETLGPVTLKKIQMELAAPHKDVDRMGKFKVESKEDLRDRGIKSPNIADALIMSLIRPKRSAATFF